MLTPTPNPSRIKGLSFSSPRCGGIEGVRGGESKNKIKLAHKIKQLENWLLLPLVHNVDLIVQFLGQLNLNLAVLFQ